MKKVAIVGGAGYTGGELLRLLINHPAISIDKVQSESHGGYLIRTVHKDLRQLGDKTFIQQPDFNDIDLVFFCSGHGRTRKYLESNPLPTGVRIIDLSADYRFSSEKNFVYGLPELYFEDIQSSSAIANPGCFASAIQLSLLPLAYRGLLEGNITVTAITGSTGAGGNPRETSHFSWRHNNLSIYKAFKHQHLIEINESLASLQGNQDWSISFIPMRGPFTRGILASLTLETTLTEEQLWNLYEGYYEGKPFVHIQDFEPDINQVRNTNHCYISVKKHRKSVHITTTLDNLIKGATGQAVQNMDIMFGFPQDLGLILKADIF